MKGCEIISYRPSLRRSREGLVASTARWKGSVALALTAKARANEALS
jgi:hypothetical protein